jgi:glutamate racemase
MTARRTCIGVFDSGFGGLTVLKALLRLIPDADYIYFGDTARLPYGSKSAETVARYAVGASHYLEQQGAQALVIACNTATALAMDKITQAAHVPVVGVIEPGTDRAAGESQNKKVVVIGTEATVSSHAYLKALQTRGIEAKEKACPLLVPLVEEGWIDHRVTEEVAEIYLKEAFTDGFKSADVLLLGCTTRSSSRYCGGSPRSTSKLSTPPTLPPMPWEDCCVACPCPRRQSQSAAGCHD